MFSILLVMCVVVVWAFGKIAQALSKGAEIAVAAKDKVGDPRDRVAKLNGSYHEVVQSGKEHLANGIVAAKHSPTTSVDRMKSVSCSLREIAVETKNRVQAEVTYHRIQRQKKAS